MFKQPYLYTILLLLKKCRISCFSQCLGAQLFPGCHSFEESGRSYKTSDDVGAAAYITLNTAVVTCLQKNTVNCLISTPTQLC